MAMDGGVVSQRRIPEKNEGCQFSPADADDVHVLAVDDSLVDRKVIERLLKISSCRVTAVDSGRRALQILGLDEEKGNSCFDDMCDCKQSLKVDLIITDYWMPGMTGYDLLKKIKESSTFKAIPVVIMSSENVLTRINRCLEEGAEDFIVKPVKLADVKRIKHCMTREAKPGVEEDGVHKRKLEETCDEPSPTPPSSSYVPSLSSPPPPLPPMPCSPSSLDSPARKLEVSVSD